MNQTQNAHSPEYDFVIFGLRYHFGPMALVQRIRAIANQRSGWELVFGCDVCGYVCTDAKRCFCCSPRGGASRSLAAKTGSAHPHSAICELPIFLEELGKDENFALVSGARFLDNDNDNDEEGDRRDNDRSAGA